MCTLHPPLSVFLLPALDLFLLTLFMVFTPQVHLEPAQEFVGQAIDLAIEDPVWDTTCHIGEGGLVLWVPASC